MTDKKATTTPIMDFGINQEKVVEMSHMWTKELGNMFKESADMTEKYWKSSVKTMEDLRDRAIGQTQKNIEHATSFFSLLTKIAQENLTLR